MKAHTHASVIHAHVTCPVCSRPIGAMRIGGRMLWGSWSFTRWQILTHGPGGQRCKGTGRLVGIDQITDGCQWPLASLLAMRTQASQELPA